MSGKSIINWLRSHWHSERRFQRNLLRDNEETALVELVFSVENPKVLDAIRQLGIETEDETVILSRKITSGRQLRGSMEKQCLLPG